MGIVEGLTEFLPISSTGHLILAGSLLNFVGAKAKVFEIAIQTGAILAVIIVYWQKIRETLVALPSSRQAQRFAGNVLIGFLPAVVLGLVFGKAIKAHLFTPQVVATTFILGAFVILWAESRPQSAARVQSVDDMTPLDALKVGLVQCLAMIPGTSRSGATIIGGMLLGLSRKAATDFSFFLAIPTLIGAGVYSLYKERALLSVADLPLFGVGLLFGKAIKANLFTPQVVATTFILGAFVILWAEKRQNTARIHSVDDMTAWDALKVGLVQCLAMVPGTSRSGATIIGGILLGLSRKAATDFSFFLAIPTLIGAGVYSLYKERALLSLADAPMFLTGLVFSFISAWLCVRWLLRYISTHSFVVFAYYRIVFGVVVLATAWLGWVQWAE